jgi:hypothetical protein
MEVRPAQEWLFVLPNSNVSGHITAVGVDADPCRVGNEVDYPLHRPIELPHLGVIAVKQDNIIREVER